MPENQVQPNEKSSELELRWLIEGDYFSFDTTLPYHSKPHDLRKVIQELHAQTVLKNVDPYDLILWKVSR